MGKSDRRKGQYSPRRTTSSSTRKSSRTLHPAPSTGASAPTIPQWLAQYPDLYADLNGLLPKEELDGFVPSTIKASTLNDKLVMLPRAQFDVSAPYYQKSLYEDDAKKAAFKEKYGYDLAPPKTSKEVSDQAVFFADPPNFYGTQFAAARKKPSMAASMKCWSLKAANIWMLTANQLLTLEAGVRERSTGLLISIKTRLFLQAQPIILG